jgi:dihydroorotase
VFIGSSTGRYWSRMTKPATDFQVIRRRAAVSRRGRIPAQRPQASARRGDPRSHPVWRDETAASDGPRNVWVKLAHETGKRIHVLHISTKQEIEFCATTQMSPPAKRRRII